mgnify:CR=1 FL=1
MSEYSRNETTKKLQANNRSFYVNAKFRDIVSSADRIQTNILDVLSENEDNFECHSIERQQRDMFMIVEGKLGKYLNIRIKQDHNLETLHFQVYMRNKHYYTFFFTMVNEKEKLDIKHTNFAVRYSIKEIEEMGIDNH